MQTMVTCTGYLSVLIDGFRWESGHAYHQMLRSAPRGLDVNQFLRTLYYGWNLRKRDGTQVANAEERIAFTKMLILSYLFRNELMFSPQITNTDLRNAPSEQARNYSNAYVRTSGSKSKFAELYQWAVMMPHIQGILVYFLIVVYPFACMVMVIPGYWKAFFTWVAFFAWVKLWDVGFAAVYVLERSVWSMIGNHSNMGRVSNLLLQTAEQDGGIGVDCGSGSINNLGQLFGGGTGAAGGGSQRPALLEADLSNICAIPSVCSVKGLEQGCTGQLGHTAGESHLFRIFDSAVTVGAGADLDLSNGYYIYIMAALYFAIPAITGQLVLGAKAGAASMVGTMIGGVAGEAGRAAMTGFQQQASHNAQTNSASLGQAAAAKRMRAGLAAEQLAAANTGLDADEKINLLDGYQSARRAAATMADLSAKSLGSGQKAALGIAHFGAEGAKALGRQKTTESGTGSSFLPLLGAGGNSQFARAMNRAEQQSLAAQAHQAATELDTKWDTLGQQMRRNGANVHAQRLGQQTQYEAEMAAWEARNAFAGNVLASPQSGGIAGAGGWNVGALTPGNKPTTLEGMAMSGYLGDGVQSQAYKAKSYIYDTAGSFTGPRSSLGSSWASGQFHGTHDSISATYTSLAMAKEETTDGPSATNVVNAVGSWFGAPQKTNGHQAVANKIKNDVPYGSSQE